MFDKLRLRLAGVETGQLILSLLAVLCGLIAGGVIILFRLFIETGQGFFLPEGSEEAYESLSPLWWFALPAVGGVVLGLFFQWLDPKSRIVGVVHTMERLAYHQGNLPLKNAIVQFFGAAISLIFGHSVGREGPSVHLGATSGSQLGMWLDLPQSSTRNLVACGVAAAIAASFNTPVAGVIFAMEVVLMEYSVAGFIPVILAAVSATALSRLVFGEEVIFSVPSVGMFSTAELPWVVITGLCIGVASGLFIKLLHATARRSREWPVWVRMSLAGVITGLIAMAYPQIMGMGYDTVASALSGELVFFVLVGLLVAKLLATAIGIGLGLPGGLIGPSLYIGAMAGGMIGLIGFLAAPTQPAEPGFYAMLGMAAMMAATLQAPLAGLTALLELTGNPHVILPGMLVVVTSALIVSQVFKQPSVFISLLKARGLDYQSSAVAQALRRVGVSAAMDSEFMILPRRMNVSEASSRLGKQSVRWVLVEDEGRYTYLLPASDVLHHLTETQDEEMDLEHIPGDRKEVAAIAYQSTLQDAYKMLAQRDMEALYVEYQPRRGESVIYGILTRDDIEAYRVPG